VAYAPNQRHYSIGLDRRSLILGVALALKAGSANAACPPVQILFVCPAGSVKSAIAREALKQRAAREGVSVAVSSRGVHPEDHASAALLSNLKRDGLNPASEPLRGLAPSDIAQADLIIAFDEASDEPILRSARAWKTPSWNADYAAAKTDLDDRLTRLLIELKVRPERPCAAP
jgi:protein-tyrosine-phosphatase